MALFFHILPPVVAAEGGGERVGQRTISFAYVVRVDREVRAVLLGARARFAVFCSRLRRRPVAPACRAGHVAVDVAHWLPNMPRGSEDP